MRQIRTYGDRREFYFCAYCGGAPDSRDHVPSRVLLDEPYPENLPIVPACEACNSGFSQHEEYLACLLGSVLMGEASWEVVRRPKVERILSRKPALAARIQSARTVRLGRPSFQIERNRVHEVIRKLGAGHSMFDLHISQLHTTPVLWMAPLPLLSAGEVESFESLPAPSMLPEVGSRALIEQAERGSFQPEWVIVQPGRYRYAAWMGRAVTIRIVLSEYLACQVEWADLHAATDVRLGRVGG